MRSVLSLLATAILTSAPLVCAAQPPANSASAALPAPTAPSLMLTPSLNEVHRTLDALRIERWKRGNIRDEAQDNIGQILRDIDINLPPLLRQADAAPGTLSTMLPVSRNVDALYDVLLRVVEASRVSAPDDQAGQLQQALITLGNARLALGDRMQGSADAMEKQVVDLRTTIQADAARRAAIPVPVALPCIPPPVHRTSTRTTRTHRPVTKPAAKPPAKTTTKPSTPNSTNVTQTTGGHS